MGWMLVRGRGPRARGAAPALQGPEALTLRSARAHVLRLPPAGPQVLQRPPEHLGFHGCKVGTGRRYDET